MKSDAIERVWSEVPADLRKAQVDPEWSPTYTEDDVVLAEAQRLSEWMAAQ